MKKSKYDTTRRLSHCIKDRIVELAKKGLSNSYICKKYAIKPNTIQHILSSKGYYKKLSENKIKQIMKCSKFTNKQIVKMRNDYLKGISSAIIAKKFNVHQSTILRICKGISYNWIPGIVKKSRNLPPMENTKTMIEVDKILSAPNKPYKPGTKPGYKRKFGSGVLKKLSKEKGMSTTSLCRIFSGKTKRPEILKELLKNTLKTYHKKAKKTQKRSTKQIE